MGGRQSDRVVLNHGVAAVLTCALLMLGCGGSGGKSATAPHVGPRPAESPSDAVNRIAAAVHSGDCSSPEEIFTTADVTPAQCRDLLPGFQPAPAPNVDAFGSGAVMKGADGSRVILALARDHRFKVATSFDASFPLEKATVSKADDVASYVLAAMRNEDCDHVLQYSLTFSNGGDGQKFCDSRQVRQLHDALTKDAAAPVPLGGDGSFAFYGLSAKGSGYFTIVFIAMRDDTWAFVTSVKA